jgi:leader peptidase (prepilin peptidase) / N-methyltransferase
MWEDSSGCSDLHSRPPAWSKAISSHARVFVTLRSPARLAVFSALSLSLSLLLVRTSGFSWSTVVLTPLILALAAIVVLDLATRIIPNLITVPMLVYALVLAALDQTTTLGQSVLGAVVGGAVPLAVAIIRRGAVGGGDVKLMASLGATLGWKGGLYVFGLAHVAGALVVLGLLLFRRRFPRDRFPIGSLLALFGAMFIAAGW